MHLPDINVIIRLGWYIMPVIAINNNICKPPSEEAGTNPAAYF